MVRMAGRLDRRITIQALAHESGGDPTAGQWQDVDEVWAEQMDQNQTERFVSNQQLAEAVRAFRIRYRTDVDPTMRVKDELGDYWQIAGVAEGDGRRAETVLVCERYDPNEREFE